ncbi:MAG: ABC transporter permease, partial [Erysipelotrichaceae bacterium]|nr:ABC transporter permease [Erysipelotrichaceae bacterium]
PIVIPEKRRAKLPFSLIWKMSFGNILNNKLRLLVTCIIVSFLTAVLSTVYTSLYVSNNVTKDLMDLSKQDHLLLVEPVPFQSDIILQPSVEYLYNRKLSSDVLIKVREMTEDNHAYLYHKTQIMLDNDWLKISDLDIDLSDYTLLESDLIPKPNEELLEMIQSSYLSFVSTPSDSVLLEDLMGRAPNDRYEVVVSNYLAEILLTKYSDLSSIEELVENEIWITFKDKMKLKLVGVVLNETPLLRSDTTILNTSYTNLYVHPTFSRMNPYPTSQISYGVKISDQTDVRKLIKDYKTIGTFTILPRYTDALNRYTRYELTLIMGLLVPLIGYFMIVFLGNYIASSILFRKKQIGILRALGCEVNEMNKIFLIEAFLIGLFIMGLVLIMVPFMIDILNFAFMVHFFDTYISYFHYPIFHLGFGHFIEVSTLIVLVFTVLIIVLTYHINLLDPVAVISGK